MGRGDLCRRGPLSKIKKPGTGHLACPRLKVLMAYFFLRYPPVKPWADLSIVPIIIVARKYAHLFVPSNVHTILHVCIRKCHFLSLVSREKMKGHCPLHCLPKGKQARKYTPFCGSREKLLFS
jgi:hypothetical protein